MITSFKSAPPNRHRNCLEGSDKVMSQSLLFSRRHHQCRHPTVLTLLPADCTDILVLMEIRIDDILVMMEWSIPQTDNAAWSEIIAFMQENSLLNNLDSRATSTHGMLTNYSIAPPSSSAFLYSLSSSHFSSQKHVHRIHNFSKCCWL